MRVAYAVTFEFTERAPLTHRGTVAASSAATCVSRAVRAAQRAVHPVAWSSVVCVLLERLADAEVNDEGEGEHEVDRTCDRAASSAVAGLAIAPTNANKTARELPDRFFSSGVFDF